MIRTVKKESKRSFKLTLPSKAYQKISSLLVKSIPYMPSNGQYDISICHGKKFIWFRVPKVGTRTIFGVFDRSGIELDADHPYRCHYPANLYTDYFKFAMVRNPWDRLVSGWKNKVVKRNHYHFSDDELLKMQQFENFVDYVAGIDIERCDGHLRLQSKMIDLNNIDYIGRFENFEENLLKILKKIGLGSVEIEKLNPSINKLPYRDYYSKTVKEKVAAIYHKDINVFSYRF